MSVHQCMLLVMDYLSRLAVNANWPIGQKASTGWPLLLGGSWG